MGQKPSVPTAAAEPKVRIDSPTSIVSSSGFYLLVARAYSIGRIANGVLGIDSSISGNRHIPLPKQEAPKKGGQNRQGGKKGCAEYHPFIATTDDKQLPVEPNWLNHPGSWRYTRAPTPPAPSGHGTKNRGGQVQTRGRNCLLYTSPSPRD